MLSFPLSTMTPSEDLQSLQTPATTPGSTFDEEKCLFPYIHQPKKTIKWYSVKKLPLGIISASVLEVLFHACSTFGMQRALRFEPNKKAQLWRFLTYMIVHADWFHLILNVLMQCLFAYFLESRQGRLKVLFLYLLGGISGVLGAACVHPELVIGASAGVYALLTSLIADIVLNFKNINHKKYRILCISILVLSDALYNIVHWNSKQEPYISWGAHVVGGLTGFFIGLVLFKCQDKELQSRTKSLQWTGILSYLSLMASLAILTLQIRKCTPPEIIYKEYVYFC